MWFLHTMAFNALFESERARRLALIAARKQSALPPTGSLLDANSVGIAEDTTIDLQPLLSASTPFAVVLLHGILWLAPVLVNLALLGSYFQLVRPDQANARLCKSSFCEQADALLGTGGWNWFKPLAPSLQDNLADQIKHVEKGEARSKYEALHDQIPYVLFPFQTWLYIAGILFGLDLSCRALQLESGIDPPGGIASLVVRALNGLKQLRAGKN